MLVRKNLLTCWPTVFQSETERLEQNSSKCGQRHAAIAHSKSLWRISVIKVNDQFKWSYWESHAIYVTTCENELMPSFVEINQVVIIRELCCPGIIFRNLYGGLQTGSSVESSQPTWNVIDRERTPYSVEFGGHIVIAPRPNLPVVMGDSSKWKLSVLNELREILSFFIQIYPAPHRDGQHPCNL